jgi:large subunit ribosomal protein L6
MSRIGRSPITVPAGVKITVADDHVLVDGPKGKLSSPVPKGISVKLEDATLTADRSTDQKSHRALHGLTRALLANAVKGVTEGFSRELDVVGIGYKAEMRGKFLNMILGYSHPIEFPVPEDVEIKVVREQRGISNYAATVVVSGIDKSRVGQVAAEIRRLRPPDAYKGKGVRYTGEVVRLKVGKKGA